MVVVPSGSFMMGSPESEAGHEDEEGPVRRVAFARPFAVGVYAVTFAEWDACEGGGGCGGHRMSAAGAAGQAPSEFCPCRIRDDLLAPCPPGPEPFRQEATNRPGCFVWNPHPLDGETVSWSGGCEGGRPHGQGREVWRVPPDVLPVQDLYGALCGMACSRWFAESAEREGEGVMIIGEGSCVEGMREGRWAWRLPDGWRSVGIYVDGKKSGYWVDRHEFGGTVWRGSYVEGRKNGVWVMHSGNGPVAFTVEGPYVEGRKTGVWVSIRYDIDYPPSMVVEEGRYVDDKKTGLWVKRYGFDGPVRECFHVDGFAVKRECQQASAK